MTKTATLLKESTSHEALSPKMDGRSFSIRGTLTLTAPLHVTAFESSWRLNDERRAMQGDKGGKPLTRMPRLSLVGDDHKLSEIPFIGSNGFRGRLRRMAAKRVQNAIGPVSMDVYHGLNCGAVSGRPAKDTVTISNAARARNNVYLGLFGGSPGMYPSRYRAFNAVPVTAATIAVGLVPKDYQDMVPTAWNGSEQAPARPDQLLCFLDFVRSDDALRFRDLDAPLVIKDYPNAMADWMAKVSDNRDAVAASKDALVANKAKDRKDREVVEKVSKSSIDAMSAIEVLVPGTKLYVRFDADDVDDAQAGLLMLSIADMVRQNRLGGWGRNGLGTFKAELAVFEGLENHGPLMPEEGSNQQIHSNLETFEMAAEDALGALDASSIADLFKEE